MSELQNNYSQHEMCKHSDTHNEDNQFTSDVHKKSSMRHYVSKKHVQTRREGRALACDVCKKIFKTPSALKLHVCSYTGQKPFTCDVRSKTFMMSGNLNPHQHIPAGQQPFMCGVCKKSFFQSDILKLHLRIQNTSDRKTRCKQLRDDLKEKRGYWQWEEEALDHTLWKTFCKTDYRINEGITYTKVEYKQPNLQ